MDEPSELNSPPVVEDPSVAEAREKARQHGWTDTSNVDYSAIAEAEPEWASNAAVYEWDGEEGDIGPANETLEDILFNNKDQQRAGDAFNALNLNVTQEGPIQVKPIANFDNAGLHPAMLANVKLCGYDKTTAVQAYCIPAILAHRDIVAVAQTGSGKTAAYLIPVISKLMGKVKKLQGPRPDVRAIDYNPDINRVVAEPLVVIVCPTRELAQQIFDEARRLCYRSMLRPVCCYGGVPLRNNIQELGKGCDILIASPGRLCDLMNKPHILSMSRVKYSIIDEADEMLHDDWSEELEKIMNGGDTNADADHLFMMFSATFPKGSRQLARQYMSQDYLRIRVGRAGSTHKNVKQDIVFVDREAKKDALVDLLYAEKPCRTLIFVNSVPGVEEVDDYLFSRALPTAFIHGKRSQFEREDAMRAFKKGTIPILISTHISGRGIDIANIGHVINYDLPSAEHGGIDEYIHRIGRTGRIGHVGRATSFYNERNEDLAAELVNILLEADQPIPDFLEPFKPESGNAEFDDETDDEAEQEAGEDGDYTTGGVSTGGPDGGAWGATEEAPVTADAWGAEPAAAPKADAWGAPAVKAEADAWGTPGVKVESVSAW